MKTLSIILLPLFLFMGCSKDDDLVTDCVESILDEMNMVAYDDQEIGCKFYLELFYYQDQEFFLLGSHCADMVSYPFDCEGNPLCEDIEDSNCTGFFANAQRLRIIGISE